jgi:hypothetical protein
MTPTHETQPQTQYSATNVAILIFAANAFLSAIHIIGSAMF